jgi:hypothetical protein
MSTGGLVSVTNRFRWPTEGRWGGKKETRKRAPTKGGQAFIAKKIRGFLFVSPFFSFSVSISLDVTGPAKETYQCMYNGPAFYGRALFAPSARSSVIQIGLDRELEAPGGDHHQASSKAVIRIWKHHYISSWRPIRLCSRHLLIYLRTGSFSCVEHRSSSFVALLHCGFLGDAEQGPAWRVHEYNLDVFRRGSISEASCPERYL